MTIAIMLAFILLALLPADISKDVNLWLHRLCGGKSEENLLGFETEVTVAVAVALPYVLLGKMELASEVKESAKAVAPTTDPSRNWVVLETTTEPEAMLVIITLTLYPSASRVVVNKSTNCKKMRKIANFCSTCQTSTPTILTFVCWVEPKVATVYAWNVITAFTTGMVAFLLTVVLVLLVAPAWSNVINIARYSLCVRKACWQNLLAVASVTGGGGGDEAGAAASDSTS